MKITILIDIKDSFFLAYIRILENKLKKISNEVYFIKNKNELKKGNILFCISCKSILKKEELKKNKFNIIAHPSKLPIDKGSAAVAHAILKNKKKIYITLFEASNKIDSGDIYSQSNFVHPQKAKKRYIILTWFEKFNINTTETFENSGIKEEIEAENDKTHYPLPLSLVEINKISDIKDQKISKFYYASSVEDL